MFCLTNSVLDVHKHVFICFFSKNLHSYLFHLTFYIYLYIVFLFMVLGKDSFPICRASCDRTIYWDGHPFSTNVQCQLCQNSSVLYGWISLWTHNCSSFINLSFPLLILNGLSYYSFIKILITGFSNSGLSWLYIIFCFSI